MAKAGKNLLLVSTLQYFLISQLVIQSTNVLPSQATEPSTAGGLASQSFVDHVSLGDRARLRGDFVDAITEYGAALKIEDDAKTRIKRANIYLVLNDADTAIAEYLAAARGGDSVEIQSRLGAAYRLKKDIPNAIAAYEKAIKLEPKDQDVQNALVQTWSDALKNNPMDPQNHLGLGQAFQRRGDFDQARDEYIRARDVSPGKTWPLAIQMLNGLATAKGQADFLRHFNAGIDLQNRKEFDAAIAKYQLAIEADPHNMKVHDIWMEIGKAYQSKEDYSQALKYYRKILKSDPGNDAAKIGVQTATHELKSK